ncbi:MAG: methyltransferase domain-containing protein [Pseudobacteriovorax sp.]|nr:methyltransferase domain-containing protein [Pseudobacteriovorax sp.]
MTDAKSYWERYYAEKKFKDGKAPNPFLVEMLPRLQKGKVLDIAMGEGTNSVFLAQKGFDVKGFDISKTAVSRSLTLAKETGVSIEANSADLDLFLLGILEYDSVIMTYFKPTVTRYYSSIISAMKQGGTLLVHSFHSSEMNEPIGKGESYRDYYFHSNELLKNLSGLRILFYQELNHGDGQMVQCLAQKPVDKDAAKLGIFDMHTKGHKSENSKQIELAEQLFKK